MKEWVAVLRAADAAARWHVHQRRKGSAQEPYINHLLEVASLVAEIPTAWSHIDVALADAALKRLLLGRLGHGYGLLPG